MPQTVLIVDDHAGFRGCARTLLEAEGFRVVGEAATGTAGVAAAEELRPELVLLDVRLPDIDGFEVTSPRAMAAPTTRRADALRARSRPDVAIVDIRMPPTQTDEGLLAARPIRAEHPGTGVLVLSHYVEPDYALELLADSAEGVGYLLKDRHSDGHELAGAARRGRGRDGARPGRGRSARGPAAQARRARGAGLPALELIRPRA